MKNTNKINKIILLAITVFTVTSLLSSCMIIPVYTWHKIDPSTVSSVQICDFYNVDTYREAFLEAEYPTYDIPEEEKEKFLAELGELAFNDSIVIIPVSQQPRLSYGRWTVRINYTDDSYQLISNNGYGRTYDKSNNPIEHHRGTYDDQKWNSFIESYVTRATNSSLEETESNT